MAALSVTVKTKFVVPLAPSTAVTSEIVSEGVELVCATSAETSDVWNGDTARVAVALIVRPAGTAPSVVENVPFPDPSVVIANVPRYVSASPPAVLL